MVSNNPTLNIDAFQWRIAETLAWCTIHGSLIEARSAAIKLRTSQLCPRDFIYSTNKYGNAYMEPSLGMQHRTVLTDVVEDVARMRVDLLKLSNIYPSVPTQHLAGGRLLCYAPYENLGEGVEEQETEGYFDVQAVPPWDTWLWFVTQQTRLQKRPYGQEFWYDAYLVSWVPPDLVKTVHTGAVDTSTTHALEWADELDSELLTQLRAANLPT